MDKYIYIIEAIFLASIIFWLIYIKKKSDKIQAKFLEQLVNNCHNNGSEVMFVDIPAFIFRGKPRIVEPIKDSSILYSPENRGKMIAIMTDRTKTKCFDNHGFIRAVIIDDNNQSEIEKSKSELQ